MTIGAGTKLGRYEIRSRLGEGGMGEVYLASDTKLQRSVALKILPSEVALDRNRMNRFVQEAKAASALNHPNILTIYDFLKSRSQMEEPALRATVSGFGATCWTAVAQTGCCLSSLVRLRASHAPKPM